MWSRVFSRVAPAAPAISFVAVPAAMQSNSTTSRCEANSDRAGKVFPSYDAEGYAHDEKAGFSMFLMERCKRVFFIRHAEGYHNLAEAKSKMVPKNAVLLKENSGFVYWDPRLTPRGEEQCANLKKSIRGASIWGYDMPLRLDLVVVSPTTRTLQTAYLSLGSAESPQAPPFVAHEGCREQISDAMCDGRRSITELKMEFPGVDFSLVETDEDRMFAEHKETEEDCQQRAQEFLQFLCGRPEVRIAVVTHSHFLKNLLRQFGSEVVEEDQEYLHGSWVNAEMRSVMICAHRKFGTNEPMTRKFSIKKQEKRVLWNGTTVNPADLQNEISAKKTSKEK